MGGFEFVANNLIKQLNFRLENFNSSQLHPFIEAAFTGKLDKLKKLLANENNFAEKNVQTLLATAAWKRSYRAVVYALSTDLFSVFLSNDPACIINRQFDKRGTHIALACVSRQPLKQPLEFLEFLLKAGADPAQNPDFALPALISVAGFYSDTRVAELLLMNGARVEDLDQAIEAALKWGNEPMVHFLLERA
ncbi:hypothetical protein BTUL_0186g00250 [Botrytis tulipae]|uniref:Ankyrin repeat protein n=1 Tax=Botrytis tulipae TaxID=87230 RepID=A0A4Z1EHU3_9HELO|nr:hypothetical protein BTUL_0186g00250 [Botrytis tulipae]